MADVKLGPQTLDEAQSSVRELIASLDAQIQSETQKFMAEREQVTAYPVRSVEDQEWQSHRLRQLTLAFEDRLWPVRQQRVVMINALVRTMALEPPTFLSFPPPPAGYTA